MMILPEIILVGTGIVNILCNVILFLGVIISGRRTSTHIYILYQTILSMVQQFASPSFHEVYVGDIYDEFNFREFLTAAYFFILTGAVLIFAFLFLMDYIPWIGNYKIVVIGTHAFISVVGILLYYFVVDRFVAHVFIIVSMAILTHVSLLLVVLLYRHLEFFTKRKREDDESGLRYFMVLVFLSFKIFAIIFFVLENLLAIMLTSLPSFGFFTFGFVQLDSVPPLVVLFKLDHKFRSGVNGLFQMCMCWRATKVQFQNLPSDNGQLINQEA